jgi:AmmeMemoRadiSam system protein B
MNRQPAVADRFYPGSLSSLDKMISRLMPDSAVKRDKALSIICPHAGYVYSGKLACETISAAAIPESVIILGPNHHGMGDRVAISTSDWNMPQGLVPIDRPFAQALVTASDLITEDERAHKNEHSLEVQVPFLQKFQKNLKIIPIAISQISYSHCQSIAEAITTVIGQSANLPLLLASTDMSHYESRATATSRDKLALDRIIDLDPQGLYQTIVKNNISMCGFIPVTITLLVSKELGATSARLVGYTDSGETSGDIDQVVGYAGFVIT